MMARWLGRLAAVLLSASAAVSSAAALLLALGHGPVGSTRTLLEPATWSDGQADAAVVPLLALLAWLCIAWLTVSVLVSVAATLPGSVGATMDAVSLRVAPAALRRLVRVALGASLAAGAVAGTALPAVATGPAAPAGRSGVAWTDLDWQVGPGPSSDAALADLEMPAAVDPGAALSGASAPGPALPTAAAMDSPAQDSPVQGVPGQDAAESPAPRRAQPELTALGGSAGAQPADPEVVVHRGDSLWSIAAKNLGPGAAETDVVAHWHRWYETNRDVIGDDPT